MSWRLWSRWLCQDCITESGCQDACGDRRGRRHRTRPRSLQRPALWDEAARACWFVALVLTGRATHYGNVRKCMKGRFWRRGLVDRIYDDYMADRHGYDF